LRHQALAAQLDSISERAERRRRDAGNDSRSKLAHLGKAIGTAFPLPRSGTFPDLLEAIDRAEATLARKT
jgi:hypothetical protein